MLYGDINRFVELVNKKVLILIFLENALRPSVAADEANTVDVVLILIFLENALRPFIKMVIIEDDLLS